MAFLSAKTGSDLQVDHNIRRRIKHKYESRQVLNFIDVRLNLVRVSSKLEASSFRWAAERTLISQKCCCPSTSVTLGLR